MGKFDDSSFHREGKPKLQAKPRPKPKPKPAIPVAEVPQSEFVKELAETGRPNWKIAPPDVKKRYNGIFLILFSIPILVMTTAELYRRLEGRSTKKVQQGEILDNGEIRKFDETEKWEAERNSLSYKIFGKDFFLDGFTSKTMRGRGSKEQTKEDQKKEDQTK